MNKFVWPSVLWAVIFLSTRVTVTVSDVVSPCDNVEVLMERLYDAQDDDDFEFAAHVRRELHQVCHNAETEDVDLCYDDYNNAQHMFAADDDDEDVYMPEHFVINDAGEKVYLDMSSLEAMGFRTPADEEYWSNCREDEEEVEEEEELEEPTHWSNKREANGVCGYKPDSLNIRNKKKSKIIPSASSSSAPASIAQLSAPWYLRSFDVLLFMAVAIASLGSLLVRHRDRMELVRAVLADVFPFLLKSKATIEPLSPKSQTQSSSKSSAKKRRKRNGQSNNGKGKHNSTPSLQQKGSFLATLAATGAHTPVIKKRRNRRSNNNNKSNNNQLSSPSSRQTESVHKQDCAQQLETVEEKSKKPLVRGISGRTDSSSTACSTDSNNSGSPPPKLVEVTEQQSDDEIFEAVMQTTAAVIEQPEQIITKSNEEEKSSSTPTTENDKHDTTTVSGVANEFTSPLSYCTQPGSEPPPLSLDVELVVAAAAVAAAADSEWSPGAESVKNTMLELLEADENENAQTPQIQFDNQSMLSEEPPRLLSPPGFSALAQHWQPDAHGKQQQQQQHSYDRMPLSLSLSSPTSFNSHSNFNSPTSFHSVSNFNSPSSFSSPSAFSEQHWPTVRGGDEDGAVGGQAMCEEVDALPSLTREARERNGRGRMSSASVSSGMSQPFQQQEAPYMQAGYNMGSVPQQQNSFNNSSNSNSSVNGVSKGPVGSGELGTNDFHSQPWYAQLDSPSSQMTSASLPHVQTQQEDVDVDESNDALVASMVRCLSMESLYNN